MYWSSSDRPPDYTRPQPFTGSLGLCGLNSAAGKPPEPFAKALVGMDTPEEVDQHPMFEPRDPELSNPFWKAIKSMVDEEVRLKYDDPPPRRPHEGPNAYRARLQRIEEEARRQASRRF